MAQNLNRCSSADTHPFSPLYSMLLFLIKKKTLGNWLVDILNTKYDDYVPPLQYRITKQGLLSFWSKKEHVFSALGQYSYSLFFQNEAELWSMAQDVFLLKTCIYKKQQVHDF